MKHKTNSNLQFRGTAVKVLAVCATSLLPLVSAVAHASLPGSNVGEVTLVLGKAWIEKPGAGRELIAVGTQIGVLDKIDTGSNSIVHIRFIDDGLYSVRAQSTLEIQRYDYDPANPANSAVKLNLIEGVNRSISGEAAHNARHNYRLNTPVAAIGVRGTDFTVIAGRDDVEARIHEGAIVVAPFSNQCLADALGPCNENGLELAYGSAQMLQIANAGDPVLLPISGSSLPESMIGESLTQPQVATNTLEEPASQEQLYPESVTTLAVNQKIAITIANGAPSQPGGPTVITPPELPPEFTPDVPIAVTALRTNQLLWGRWYEPAAAYERITVDYDTASEGRKPAVGNNVYGLFRMEGDVKRVQPGLGTVGFALDSAQAVYKNDGLVEMLDVSGGMLRIDFDANTFATSLNLRGTPGTLDFNANGRILDGGYFNMSAPTQVLSGAVSLDGKEAGYVFEKTLDSGLIEGLTLWGRQP